MVTRALLAQINYTADVAANMPPHTQVQGLVALWHIPLRRSLALLHLVQTLPIVTACELLARPGASSSLW